MSASPWLIGNRLTLRPWSGAELGLTRTAQWGGAGRDQSARGFVSMLFGRGTYASTSAARARDPGNQMAGFGPGARVVTLGWLHAPTASSLRLHAGVVDLMSASAFEGGTGAVFPIVRSARARLRAVQAQRDWATGRSVCSGSCRSTGEPICRNRRRPSAVERFDTPARSPSRPHQAHRLSLRRRWQVQRLSHRCHRPP